MISKKPKLKRFVQRHWNKSSIVFDIMREITNRIPDHKKLTFVDLFWGWWSVSANATYFFKNVIYNEFDKNIVDLFIWVQNDDLIKKLKPKWISRDYFNNILNRYKKWKKITLEENLILTIWSFWNTRNFYMYWKNFEYRKKLAHKIIFSKTEQEYKKYIKEWNDNDVCRISKYWWEWSIFLYDNDWELFLAQKTIRDKKIYKFWSNSKNIRKFYKTFDLDLIIKSRWNYKNQKDIDLINNLKEIKNLERLEKLENLKVLERLEKLENLQHLEWLGKLEHLERLERLERLEKLQHLEWLGNLEHLERLERLERLEKLENNFLFKNISINNKDYRDVKLPNPDECIIYCDPPYKWTLWYWDNDFDHYKFYNYILQLKNKWYKIFISEYNFPFWEVIWSKNKRWFRSQTKDNFTWKEKLYMI